MAPASTYREICAHVGPKGRVLTEETAPPTDEPAQDARGNPTICRRARRFRPANGRSAAVPARRTTLGTGQFAPRRTKIDHWSLLTPLA